MKRLIPFALLAGLFLLGSDGCQNVPQSEQIQNQAQERQNMQAVRSVGMPAISNFFEKRQYKSILELRDHAVSTVTYIADLSGHLHKMCDSVGFGIPYSTQYTNPAQPLEQDSDGSPYHGTATIPQADPNGLYSPSSAEGTWVLCLDPKTKQISALYSEPPVVVSQYPLQTQ